MPKKYPPINNSSDTAPVNGANDKQDAETIEQLNREFHVAKNSMQQFRTKWEDYLDTAYARLVNQAGFKSRVREGTLSNLLWERAARVVAQLPTGRIQALDKDDVGKSKLMDLVWHKYVMPGANTDYSFFTKLRMWDYYSMVYGACPAIYDYRVDDEYTGPDWTVLDPRYVFPQAGRLSIQRCQYVFIEAYHNKEYIKSKVDNSGWITENLNKIISEWKDGAQPDNSRRITNLQNDRGQSIDLHRGEIQLVTKYERGKKGHWITFAPQYDNMIVRDIPNPHKNGRLPVVFKFCFPLLDSIWGMGDVERGQSLQNAIDSFINMAMDFSKFRLYPMSYYTDGVNASQIRYEPGAKTKLPNKDAFGFIEPSASSSQEMTEGYQFMSGALNRQNGSTTTNIAQGEGSPSQGKTPKAIQENQQTENARDNWDTAMLEDGINELSNGMINLIGTKQPSAIEFHIFDDDIKSIYDSGGKDVIEIFDSAKKHIVTEGGELDWELSGKGAAKLTLGPDDLKGAYRYEMDSDTTRQADDDDESQSYDMLLEAMGTDAWSRLEQGWMQEGRQFSYGNFGKKMLIAKGIDNWEDLIPETSSKVDDAKPFDPSMLQDPQAMAMWQQSQGGQPQQPQDPSTPGQPPSTNPQPPPPDPMLQKQNDQIQQLKTQLQIEKNKPSQSISYNDASPLTKAQMEHAEGYTPDPVHQLEEQALMAQHSKDTVSHNLDMQTPRSDPNAVGPDGQPLQPNTQGVPQ